MEELLRLENVWASVQEKQILHGLNLTINKGETHVIMGPNGAGKSTLANIILNNPAYEKTSGKIIFDGHDITNSKTNDIAKAGIFMSFQSPEEIPGISVFNFLKTAKNKITEQPVYGLDLKKEIDSYTQELNMNGMLVNRDFNVGFSGGEKKKNEILQMLTLKPKLAILDETDSGLDVDAIRIVSKGINMYKNNNNAVLIITHSTKILEFLKVDYVHILVDGKIVKTGNADLAKAIENDGYKKWQKEDING